jgi:hypothetical protein
MAADPQGPFVAAALLCQSVTPRDDGSVDIGGIVDGLAISRRQSPADPLALAPHALVELTALVSVRAGSLRGPHRLGLRGTFPSGRPGAELERPVELTDDRPGANLVVPLEIPVFEAGLHLFDVVFDGELLTRMELHIDLQG